MPELIIAIVVALLLTLAFVLIIRTLRFKPEGAEKEKSEPVFVNTDAAASTLAEMIKCRTVSSRDKSEECEAEFLRFEKLLFELFPRVTETCEFEKPSDRSLLFRWRGKSDKLPTVLMSHYDVVSVEEDKWEKPAFGGIIENGVLWGRGTLDTKGTLNAILNAAETLISDGYVPERDIYFAFGGDEEINGHGAEDIVKLFTERGIEVGLVLDEGGAVVDNVFPGVKSPCALIGISEKGMLNVEYSVSGGGGHASSPSVKTPVNRLASACTDMQKNPFKFRLTKPAFKMLKTVGRHSTFFYRLIFANLWFFSPVLNLLTRLTGGELNALMRTTTAFTVMEGSKGMNVIPPYARMISNHRIIPGETMESTLKTIRKTVRDEKVEIRIIDGMQPSSISDTEGEAWRRVTEAVGATWQSAIVSPYLMLACSDSRHWSRVSDKVYRFSAMALSKEERGTIHGNNERIPLDTVAKACEFYIRLMRNS